MAHRLLIIEDDAESNDHLVQHFRQRQWQVETALGVNDAKSILLEDEFNPHVIIADLGLPDGNILDHLEELQEQVGLTEWVFLYEPGSNSDDSRIDDLTFDFLHKPYDIKRLDTITRRALRTVLTERLAQSYSSQHKQKYHVDSFYGSSQQAKSLKAMLNKLVDIPISAMIITGETGTGKGLVARIIHHSGLRSDGPIVELNCAALPKDLLESQLFGHESGAFTGAAKKFRGLFEQADGGTLFLDEIGDMDIELQSKLLKAIEDQTIRRLGSEKEIHVDVQVIAATGVNLNEAIAQGQFRDDLYHRISVFKVHLPSLRERKDDLMELVPRIIGEFNTKANKRVNHISDASWEKLLSYDWPGNVRELRNVLERCVLLSNNEHLPDEWLQLSSSGSYNAQQAPSADHISIPIDGTMGLEDVELAMLTKALLLEDNNVTAAAKRLKITRETMRYRMKKFEL